MNARVNVLLLLGFGRRLFQYAAKCRLDMTARTSESVVKIEMAKSGIEVVRIQASDDITPHPNTFRIAGRPGQLLRDFEQFIDPRRFLLLFALLLGLVALVWIVLRQGGPCRERKDYTESW